MRFVVKTGRQRKIEKAAIVRGAIKCALVATEATDIESKRNGVSPAGACLSRFISQERDVIAKKIVSVVLSYDDHNAVYAINAKDCYFNSG